MVGHGQAQANKPSAFSASIFLPFLQTLLILIPAYKYTHSFLLQSGSLPALSQREISWSSPLPIPLAPRLCNGPVLAGEGRANEMIALGIHPLSMAPRDSQSIIPCSDPGEPGTRDSREKIPGSWSGPGPGPLSPGQRPAFDSIRHITTRCTIAPGTSSRSSSRNSCNNHQVKDCA